MEFDCTVILNPNARSEKALKLLSRQNGIRESSRILVTEGPGDATSKAQAAFREGSRLIVAAGGDGTINEVINGIAQTDGVLGVLPLGSVNVLARELGIPLRLDQAWEVIKTGVVQKFDLVKIDYFDGRGTQSRFFVQVAGVGLDAHVIQQVTRERKKLWGYLSYLFEMFKHLSRRLPKIKVQVENEAAVEGAFALIGNGSFYGGPFPVFHKASMTDGILDLCVFESMGFGKILFYAQAVFRGAHEKTKGIYFRQTRSVRISSESKVPVEVDGEFLGYLPVCMTVVPKALNIIVPRIAQ